jgi:hypothetical protein
MKVPPTKPNCAQCGVYLGEEKKHVLSRLNFCGTYPTPYCDKCYAEIKPDLKVKCPPKKKSFARRGG